MSKIILTGDRPTGRLHVGHYVGSLAERVKLQNSGLYDEIYIMIADAQALTDNAEHPEKVRQNILQVSLDYLACGLDPEKSNIFIQHSGVFPHHTHQEHRRGVVDARGADVAVRAGDGGVFRHPRRADLEKGPAEEI